ncbi:hypothetical protein NDU88_008164 [Pleurodeles waltl]|uniref:Uncharacterized protein n=1 Tax=Pleurodeles waltl TaxID=8319 RepID=A0AAV7QR14_PLEWA|nr:hypothetical protein NDU88_008164 [Pleurodeles waltl]
MEFAWHFGTSNDKIGGVVLEVGERDKVRAPLKSVQLRWCSLARVAHIPASLISLINSSRAVPALLDQGGQIQPKMLCCPYEYQYCPQLRVELKRCERKKRGKGRSGKTEAMKVAKQGRSSLEEVEAMRAAKQGRGCLGEVGAMLVVKQGRSRSNKVM